MRMTCPCMVLGPSQPAWGRLLLELSGEMLQAHRLDQSIGLENRRVEDGMKDERPHEGA